MEEENNVEVMEKEEDKNQQEIYNMDLLTEDELEIYKETRRKLFEELKNEK